LLINGTSLLIVSAALRLALPLLILSLPPL
jgi:hypothetical protein